MSTQQGGHPSSCESCETELVVCRVNGASERAEAGGLSPEPFNGFSRE